MIGLRSCLIAGVPRIGLILMAKAIVGLFWLFLFLIFIMKCFFIMIHLFVLAIF